MVRIFIPFFYRLGASLQAVRYVQSGTNLVPNVWSDLYNAQQNLDTMLSTSWFAPAVRAAYTPGTRLLTALRALTDSPDFTNPRPVTPVEAYELADALNVFETVLGNELQNADTYFVTRKGAYDTSVLISNGELIFSAELATKVTCAIPDAREAGKCLAFELSTAAGFHVMRCVESVVRAYWDAVTKGKQHPTGRSLGVYIQEMENEKAGSDVVLAALKQLKDLHRNPLIHPEVSLNLEEAIGVFGMAQSVVNAMLKEIETPAAPAAPAQAVKAAQN